MRTSAHHLELSWMEQLPVALLQQSSMVVSCPSLGRCVHNAALLTALHLHILRTDTCLGAC